MKPGEIRVFDEGQRIALCLVMGVWAERKKEGGPISIHLTGTKTFHTTVTNQVGSERYHRTLFRDLRQVLVENGRWPYGDNGKETEVKP